MKNINVNPNIEIVENENLKKLSTIKTGGEASVAYPKNIDELIELLKFVKKEKINYYILGNGSNILLPDKLDEDGLIISVKKMEKFLNINQDVIEVSAFYPAIPLCLKLSSSDLTGHEFMSGIPGLIGGLIFMNAGAYKKEIKDILIDVTFLNENLEVKTLLVNECDFSYRKSIFHKHDNWIIISASFKLDFDLEKKSKEIIQKRKKYRLETQPLDQPNFGSVFKNISEKESSWKIIDDLELRGYKRNNIMVSEKHSNFIVNKGGGTTDDVLHIINKIKTEVKNSFGYDFYEEVIKMEWKKYEQ